MKRYYFRDRGVGMSVSLSAKLEDNTKIFEIYASFY